MSEISKEAVEAATECAKQVGMFDLHFHAERTQRVIENMTEPIQSAIDIATAAKDKRIALMEEAGLWQCGRIAEMEKILDNTTHARVSYKLQDGDIHYTCHPTCPRCAWEKIKGLK